MANLACGYCLTETLPDAEAVDGFCKVLLPLGPPCLPQQHLPPLHGHLSPAQHFCSRLRWLGSTHSLQLAFIASSTSTELNILQAELYFGEIFLHSRA